MSRTRLAMLAFTCLTLGFLVAYLSPARAQTVIPTTSTAPTIIPGGVYLDPDGMIHRRTPAPENIAALRACAKAALQSPQPDQLAYVSLPRALAAARLSSPKSANARQSGAGALTGGANLPDNDNPRYLGGLTQIQYIFLFPDDHDLVLAGPVETPAADPASPLQPCGSISGRPFLQLDDFVTAWRTTAHLRANAFIGCSIDPKPTSLTKAQSVMDANPRASDADLARLVAAAVGPEQISIFNVPRDTRFALVLVSADFQMKRFSMGLESSPIATFGNGVGNSRSAANRFWFDSLYDPLLVSADGDSYALRGQRLQLKCGAVSFDERGATPEAKAFAAAFTKNIPTLAATIPVFADLQNVSDLALLANLIRRDKLDQRLGWDIAAALADYTVPATPAPKTVETQAGMTSGSIVAGGIAFHFTTVLAPDNRQPFPAAAALTALRQRPQTSWISHASGAAAR